MMFSGHSFHFRVLFVLTMFLYLGKKESCVRLSFCSGGGGPMSRLPMIIHPPPPPGGTSGQDWRPIQTCSPEDPPLVLTSSGYWQHVRFASGWCTHSTGMLSRYAFVSYSRRVIFEETLTLRSKCNLQFVNASFLTK